MSEMEKLKRNQWKIIRIVLICTLFDIIVHYFGPDTLNTGLPKSVIVKNGLLIPAAILLFFITFGALAGIFVLIQDTLPGTKFHKGLLYGLSFGGLWFIGMFEPGLSPLWLSFFSGLADGLPILLLGILLGVFTATDTGHNLEQRAAKPMLSIFAVALLYIIGRYFSYAIIHIDSAYSSLPFATFFWTVGMGLWVGVMVQLLKQGVKGNSPLKRALMFGGLIYGTDWLLYNLFMLLFFEISLADLVLRTGTDAIFVSAGVFIFERFVHLSKMDATAQLQSTFNYQEKI
jgi:hypothetical protein